MRPQDLCPFVPGSGRVPAVWAGRATELADGDAVVRRRAAGIYERGRAVIGEFGIGKSVLVNRVAEGCAADGHWVARPVRVPNRADPVPLLAEALQRLVTTRRLDDRIGHRAAGLLQRIEQITLPVVGGGIGLRDADPDGLAFRDVYHLAEHVATLAHHDRRVVLLRIDELQNADLDGLSRLLTILGDLLEVTLTEHDAAGLIRERHLPVVVYLSGLPDLRERVGMAGGTFARRFRTFDLAPLEEPELRAALLPFTTTGWEVLGGEGPVHVRMEDPAVDHIVTACLGDPFLFQLAGEAAWRAGEGEVITASEATRGWRLVRREVVGYVQGRLGNLSDLQLAFLRAAASISDEDRTGDAVARELGRSGAKDLASTAQALDRTHRLIRREAGMIRFRSESVRAWLAGGWP